MKKALSYILIAIGIGTVLAACGLGLYRIEQEIEDVGYDRAMRSDSREAYNLRQEAGRASVEAEAKYKALEAEATKYRAGVLFFAKGLKDSPEMQRNLRVVATGTSMTLGEPYSPRRLTYNFTFDPMTGQISDVVVK